MILEMGMAIRSSIRAWRIPLYSSQGCKELDTTEWLSIDSGKLKMYIVNPEATIEN